MRAGLPWRWLAAGLLALASAWSPAAAQRAAEGSGHAAQPVVVLESHVGQRPANADALLAPLLDELDRLGFAARPAAVLGIVGRRAPRPGVLDPGTTAAEITAARIMQAAESGYAAYTRGHFAEAEAALGLAIERIHRNPALLVLDTNNLEATFKILVALALSQAKRGDTRASVATMIELIRTFHSQPITRIDYGPDAEQFYRAVARQVQALGRGRLSISGASDQAVIFVDGQIRGLGRATLVDAIPGVYRVFVQIPGTPGRQYEVEVGAGRDTVLAIDWELDTSLWLTDGWVGLLFATEADRARQASFAGALARRWSSEQLAVVGIVALDGKPAIVGQLYDAAGRHVRGAIVAPVGDVGDEPRLRALARFLADGTPAEGLRVLRDGPLPGAATASGRNRLAPHIGRLLVGTGAAALVAGGVLYAIDQDPGGPSPVTRNTAPAGIAVGAVGLAAVSVGLWLWAARTGGSSPMLAVGSSGGFIGWGGTL
jgi:hypothetical protein